MSGKQRSIRKRRALDEEEEASAGEPAAAAEGGGEGSEPAAPKLTAEDIRALQKQRQRRTGVEAGMLMAADTRQHKKISSLTIGGGSATQDVLQAAFKRERRLNTEEEDPHMKKYVEEQLAKRMGRSAEEEEEEAARVAEEERAIRMADPLLSALPEGLQKRQQDTELGNSWVAGITEVPLSMEQKMKNIEDTEAAKKKMLTMGGRYADDEDEGDGRGTRRGAFPVAFGRQDPKHLKVIAEAHAKKARMRERQEEKKKQKLQEFAGW